MSEEAVTTQDNTSAVQGSEAQAQAPSAGEQVLKPAATLMQEQQAINEATPVSEVDRAQAPAEPKAQSEDVSSEAKEQDLGLLGKTKPKESEGAPEAYEAFTPPEGMELDEGDQQVLQGIAKEMGLSQSAAQAGAEMTARALNQMIEAAQAEAKAHREEQVKLWEQQPHSAEKTLLAKKAIEHAGLMDYMEEAGYLYDANLLNAFSAFGALISEAKVIVGSEGALGGAPQNPYRNSPEFK